MLKIPTGSLDESAICSAMLSAKAVLPMLGRPAITIRSPSCNPEVMWSRSVNPVGTPVPTRTVWMVVAPAVSATSPAYTPG